MLVWLRCRRRRILAATWTVVTSSLGCGLLSPDDPVDASAPSDSGVDVVFDSNADASDARDAPSDADAATPLSCGSAAPYGISACCVDSGTVCRGFCDKWNGGACSCGIAGGCKGDAYCCNGACQSAQECVKK
ncbi:hypothetical protein BH09MYX1_BH09MYX1_57280 [soil metagenome]